MREIISLHIGQAGIQAGNICWDYFCLEHGIQLDGTKKDATKTDVPYEFFYESNDNKFTPRCILFDTEPSVNNSVKCGRYRSLFEPNQYISGKEDCSNSFANIYSHLYDTRNLKDGIRKLAEKCDSLQGFHMYHSLGGGTGSGSSMLYFYLATDYFGKKLKFDFGIYPSIKTSTSVLEPYNALLALNYITSVADVAFVFDNESLYDICKSSLSIGRPTYNDMNHIIAKVISSLTSTIRFSTTRIHLDDFSKTMVTDSKMKYLLTSYSPISKTNESVTLQQITDSIFEPMNSLAKCNPKVGKYSRCKLIYRGNVIPEDVAESSKRAAKLIEYKQLDYGLVSSYQMQNSINCCMVSNTSSIVDVFSRIAKQFDILDSRQTYYHSYCGCLETRELREARYSLESVMKDYNSM